jgi:hypothetical protein
MGAPTALILVPVTPVRADGIRHPRTARARTPSLRRNGDGACGGGGAIAGLAYFREAPKPSTPDRQAEKQKTAAPHGRTLSSLASIRNPLV